MTSTQPNKFEADQYSIQAAIPDSFVEKAENGQGQTPVLLFLHSRLRNIVKSLSKKHSKMTVTALVFSILKV